MQDENWQYIMLDELKAIEKSHTWELIKNSGKKAIDVRWVYKPKLKSNCKIVKFKARLVEKGFFPESLELILMKFMH